MKTILIPTDFTIDSLSLVKNALNDEQESKVNIILAYGKKLPWSAMDLLYLSKNKFILNLQDEDFIEAKEIISNKYKSKINSFKIDVFHGFNQNAFNNFISSHRATHSVIPEDDTYFDNKFKGGFNITTFIRKSDLHISTVQCVKENAPVTHSSLFKLITS
ncbi:hypothetical protein [Mariniflexile sp.]|uniref:hypothetical protein n=1 Tax=Mariniflexile sp. TaxID=1979402 RepID=UPI0035699CB9